MRSPLSVKQEFLKRWLRGLHIYDKSKKEMTILERKKAIKLTADVAMASTSTNNNAATRWSRAFIAQISRDESNKILVQHLSQRGEQDPSPKNAGAPMGSIKVISHQNSGKMMSRAIASKKRILRKSQLIRKRANRRRVCHPAVDAGTIAKRLVKHRTKMLKSLVPGGEFMDDISLIKETLDYIVSLRLQVDVMHKLATAAELLQYGSSKTKPSSNS